MRPIAAPALILALSTLCATSAAAQQAPDWSATFHAEAMKAHQRGAERHIVLPGDANAREAAAALTSGLRAAGAPLVMDSAALGDTNSPEDSFLLAKASPLPVELVWIVRVYPGAQPDQQSAVLLVYENSGAKLRYAVQATPAKPLDPPPAATSSAASGVSADARDAVTDDKKPPKKAAAPPPSADSEQKYLNNYLGFVETQIPYGGTPKTILKPFRGRDRREISWPEFYEITGRSDLAEEYRSNETTGTALMVGGFIAAIPISSALFTFGILETDQGGSENAAVALLVGGGVTFIGGLIAMIAGGSYSADPSVVDNAENRKLARTYNESLQESLGVEVREDSPSSFNLQIAPMFHTPGVVFQLNF